MVIVTMTVQGMRAVEAWWAVWAPYAVLDIDGGLMADCRSLDWRADGRFIARVWLR